MEQARSQDRCDNFLFWGYLDLGHEGQKVPAEFLQQGEPKQELVRRLEPFRRHSARRRFGGRPLARHPDLGSEAGARPRQGTQGTFQGSPLLGLVSR